MTTKLAAARIATASGIQVCLGNGRNPAVVRELLCGGDHGTRFLPNAEPIPDRKGWLAHALVPEADVLIDAGAEKALIEQGARCWPLASTASRVPLKPNNPCASAAAAARN